MKYNDICAKINSCNSCSIEYNEIDGCNRHVVGSGNINSNIVCVLDAPTHGNVVNKDIASEKYFKTMLNRTGLRAGDMFVTSAVSCFMNNRPALVYELYLCKQFLHDQINLVKPKLIITFGDNAATSILGNYISKNMIGTIVKSDTFNSHVFIMSDIKYLGPYVEDSKRKIVSSSIKKLKKYIKNIVNDNYTN